MAWGLLSLLLLGAAVTAGDSELRAAESALDRFVGRWETVVDWHNPSYPEPLQWRGESTYELVGRRWLVSRHQGDFLGMGYEARESLGYDGSSEQWVSVWVDQFSSSMLRLQGSLGADGFRLEGRAYDEDRKQWVSVSRQDEWDDAGRLTTRFKRFDAEGTMVEQMVITHSRAEPVEGTSR